MRRASLILAEVLDSSGISPLLTSLVSHWSLEEASGTRADDWGGNTLADNNTVTQAAGKVGNCAVFTAANSEFLNIASNASLALGDVSFTIAGWYYLTTKAAGVFVSKDGDGGGKRGFDVEYHVTNDVFRVRLFKSGDTEVNQEATTFGSPSTGTWYFVVAWHNATADTMGISVNDGAVNSKATGGALQADGGAEVQLGARQFAGARAFLNGRIDQVLYTKRLLTATEITWLYNAGAGRSWADILAYR